MRVFLVRDLLWSLAVLRVPPRKLFKGQMKRPRLRKTVIFSVELGFGVPWKREYVPGFLACPCPSPSCPVQGLWSQ